MFIQVIGTVRSTDLDLYTSSKDVGETDKLKLSYLEEDGIVSELTEEDTELQLVSVTESPVLTPYSSEDKVTTVDVETTPLPSPRDTEIITDNIHNTGTVKLLDLSITSEDVGLTDKLKPSGTEEDGCASELTEEDTELQLVSVTESPVLTPYSSEDKVTTVDVEMPLLLS